MGLGVNSALAYPNYFAMIPTGPDPNAALPAGFFALAATQKPRPSTVALVSADAEFSRNPILGAKDNAKKYGFAIVPRGHLSAHDSELHASHRRRCQKQLRSPASLFLHRRFDRAGARGPCEWVKPRVLQVQFQGISGAEVGQFQDGRGKSSYRPPQFTSGELHFPYADALSSDPSTAAS